MKKHTNRSVLLPDIFSMQDFVAAQSGLRFADSITLAFELYEVHKLLKKENAEPFTTFLKYSSTIIHDFNEIDFHLIDSSEAFRFLTDLSKLQVWDVEDTHSNPFKRRYVNFFKELESYYDAFSQRLLGQGLAYQGLAYRRLTEQSLKLHGNWDKVYFAGFNALTPAEQRVIDNVVKSGKGELIWDVDAWYMDNEWHEAGMSLRRLVKKWPAVVMESDNFREQTKDILMLGAPGAVAQVKAAGEVLNKFSDEDDVAIVLADESLLEPLINSIPQHISTFNITMGLPLENTMLFSLFSALFKLHTAPYTMDKAKTENGEVLYYFRDVLRVLSHPVVLRLIASYSRRGQSITSPAEAIQSFDVPFYSQSSLEKLHHKIGVADFEKLGFLWDDWEQNPDKAMGSMITLLENLRQTTEQQDKDDLLMPEYVARFHAVLLRIKTLQKKFKSLVDIEVLWHLFRQLTAREEVNFRGEPLKGIQVMGMLETRILDFKNVIVIGANEEFLPGTHDEVSFMPFEMRMHYQLPMKNDSASVVAYHFYHLLQRAEDITLIYSNSAEGLRNSEESRFLKQIRYELASYNSNIRISEEVAAVAPDISGADDNIVIEKTEKLFADVREKAAKGLSATSLNKYRQCSLKFYFEEILGVSQQEEVEETIEAKTLGNVVHKTLEKLYGQFEGDKLLIMKSIESMQENVEKMLTKTFEEEYQKNSYQSGKNLLIYHLALHWLRGFLQNEKDTLKETENNNQTYSYLESEAFIKITRDVQSGNNIIPVVFKGHIDRIDKIGDTIRIIDYKTGKVQPTTLRLQSVDDLEQRDDRKEAFQLLFYRWLYQNSHDASESLQPAILSFPALRQGVMPLSLKDEGSNNSESDFEAFLMRLVREILNPELAFRKTENRENCKFCDFKNICNRHT